MLKKQLTTYERMMKNPEFAKEFNKIEAESSIQNHNIKFNITKLKNNTNLGYYAHSKYYNIFTYGDSIETALQEANECFDFFLHHYIKTKDQDLTKEAIKLKQKYIQYYEDNMLKIDYTD